MTVLLSGVTGNLGYEIALELQRRDITIISIIRPTQSGRIKTVDIVTDSVVNDLMTNEKIELTDSVDCIVHAAGNIHFYKTGRTNETITGKLVDLAKKLDIPFYHISTAFLYRPSDKKPTFTNAYELDKFNAEQIVISSGVTYGMFRPAILVGNSKTGIIQNFSGYYNFVKAFYAALTISKQKKQKLRFPLFSAKANLVTTDQAAYYICNKVQRLKFGTWYLTNPAPPTSIWVLMKTLEFFNLDDSIDLMNITFEEYENLTLTKEERSLFEFVKHYLPYILDSYNFPLTLCKDNMINSRYLSKTLTFLQSTIFLNE